MLCTHGPTNNQLETRDCLQDDCQKPTAETYARSVCSPLDTHTHKAASCLSWTRRLSHTAHLRTEHLAFLPLTPSHWISPDSCGGR